MTNDSRSGVAIKRRVAVIGGGISGIAAALTLSRSELPLEITLFEAGERLGGVLETVREGNYLVEKSADNFATLIPDALELSEEFEAAGDLIRPVADNRQAFVMNNGSLQPIPAGFSLMQPTRVFPILFSRALSWPGKFRLLGEFFVPKRAGDRDALGADESLQSFATRRLGLEAYENLVEPIVSGIFTADPSTLSMQATMPQFVEMERKHGGLIRGYLAARRKDAAAVARKASGARYDQFMAPRNGMSTWIAQLARQLPTGCVRLSHTVKHIAHDTVNGTWKLTIDSVSPPTPSANSGTCSPQESVWNFDAVLVSTPAVITSHLLKSVHPEASSIVANIPYASSAVVAMIVNKAELAGRIDGFGMIVPRKEGRPTLAISYSSNKYADRVPDGEILLRIFLGGALNPSLVDEDDKTLCRIAAEELRTILGWTGTEANWQRVIRWRSAMPQYLIGHVNRMRQLNALLAETPTLKLCGAAYQGVGIPQCVRGGRKAAREIIEYFGSTLSDSTSS